MAKKKIKDMKKDLLDEDFEIDDTDYQLAATLLLAEKMGRLASKP